MRLLSTILFLCFFGNISFATLSNDLPLSLVEELIEQGEWSEAFDNSKDARAQELKRFWGLLNSEQLVASPEAANPVISSIIDELVSTQSKAKPIEQMVSLYPVKIKMLRHWVSKKSSSIHAQIIQRWFERYIQSAVELVRLSEIHDLQRIANKFFREVQEKKITLLDLTPGVREEIAKKSNDPHVAQIRGISPDTKKYQVTGAYNAESKTLTLDLARPINETLITLVHEMVHASDPFLEEHRKQYEKLYPQVVELISQLLNGQKLENLSQDILEHLLFETGATQFAEIAHQVRRVRIGALKVEIKKVKKVPELTKQQKSLLHQYFRSVLSLTVDNEYRAYGYSLSLYLKLKNKYMLLPPSSARQKFIENFIAGDNIVRTNLSLQLNPFRKIRTQVFSQFLQGTDLPAGVTKNEDFIHINYVLNILEINYLETTEKVLREQRGKFSALLQGIQEESFIDESTLPLFARTDGLDSPTNPFQILSARLTTTWVIRFRQTLKDFYEDIRSLNEPLVMTSMGILDLHDLTAKERELVGISYKDSPWTHQPESVKIEKQNSLQIIPDLVEDYFKKVNWSPSQATAMTSIAQEELERNILRLRVITSSVWLDRIFPTLNLTLSGVGNFIQLLRDGQYDDMNAERAQKLLSELLLGFKETEDSRFEFERLVVLSSDLSRLKELSRIEGGDWKDISGSFDKKARFVVEALEKHRIYSEHTVAAHQAFLQTAKVEFTEQIDRYKRKCRGLKKDKYRISALWLENKKYEVSKYQFPLSLICYQKQLYAVRQPGDHLESLTTLIKDMRPEVRIFFGSRGVKLSPMK